MLSRTSVMYHFYGREVQRKHPLRKLGVQLLFGAIFSSSCASNRALSGKATCRAQAPRPKVVHSSRRSKTADSGYGELHGGVFVGDQAVDHAVIRLVDSTGQGHRGQTSAYSNPNGKFTIARVHPGIYELEAWAPGFTVIPRQKISIRSHRAVSMSICLVRDQSTKGPSSQYQSSHHPPSGE